MRSIEQSRNSQEPRQSMLDTTTPLFHGSIPPQIPPQIPQPDHQFILPQIPPQIPQPGHQSMIPQIQMTTTGSAPGQNEIETSGGALSPFYKMKSNPL